MYVIWIVVTAFCGDTSCSVCLSNINTCVAPTQRRFIFIAVQWLEWSGTQGTQFPRIHFYGSKRSPTSDCYNARGKHAITDREPKPECTAPHL